LNGKTTGILLSLCIGLVGWNLGETIALKTIVATAVEKSAELERARETSERRLAELEAWKNRHEGRIEALRSLRDKGEEP
jgi:hypothetical protein